METQSQEWNGLKENYSSILIERGKKHFQEWWNIKFYKRTGNEDGSKPQTFIRKTGEAIIECPYNRETAFLSQGRFALTDNPTSYWASSWLTVICESIPEFREDSNLTDEKIAPYLKGKHDPNKKDYGYNLTQYFKNETPLLNLTDPNTPFFSMIEKYDLWKDANSFFNEVIFSRDEKAYPLTQAIADLAYKNGYYGIKYKSVRRPHSSIYRDPDDCIALFNESNLCGLNDLN